MSGHKQALYEKAVAQYRAGEWLGARRLVESILAVYPREYVALSLLAAVYFKCNDLDLAEEIARIVLAMDPEDHLCLEVLENVARIKQETRESFYFSHYMLSRFKYLEYPHSVSIETTGQCNAACTFCPHPGLERNSSSMSDALFEKIMTDLEAIPRDHEFTITPGAVNEPFMDKKLFPRLRMINHRLPQAKLHFFTNLNVMHRDFAEQIGTIRNIELINVSFNAANAQEYESVMKIDFQRTVKNLKFIMELNRQIKFMQAPLVLSRVSDGTDADQDYEPQVRALFADFEVGQDYVFKVKNRTNWLNKLNLASSDIPFTQPCFAWFSLVIYNNGLVPHCCMDSDGAFALGDVTKNSVLDIYNTPDFKQLRASTVARSGAGTPCNQCSLLQ